MATLGLKEIGKFVWERREKVLPCWLCQFSKTKLENGKKSGTYYEKWVGRHASFPPRQSVNSHISMLGLAPLFAACSGVQMKKFKKYKS